MGNKAAKVVVNPVETPIVFPVSPYEKGVNIPFVQKIDTEILGAAAKIDQFRQKRDIYGLTNEDIQQLKHLKLTIESKMKQKKSYGW